MNKKSKKPDWVEEESPIFWSREIELLVLRENKMHR